jgi:hypothetical protein
MKQAKFDNESEQAHSDMVFSLCKPGATLCDDMTPDLAHKLHMVLGIAGEAAEIQQAVCEGCHDHEIILELGDLAFYTRGLALSFGFGDQLNLASTKHHSIDNGCAVAKDLTVAAGELVELFKKHWAYNKDLIFSDVAEKLQSVTDNMNALANFFGLTGEAVLDANVEKLGKRYKNHQYSDEQAIKRADTKSEPADE